MSITDLKNRLQKNVKGTHIEILAESDIAIINTYLDGPSYDINRIISGSLFRGFPEKSVTCLVAPEGVFKSSLMAITAADAQRNGYTPVIIDTEGAFTDEFCRRWGIDTENIIYIYTIFVEKITTLLGDILDNQDQKLFLVLDSLGGLESDKIIRDTTSKDRVAKADQGGLARKIKRMLKMFVSVCKSQNSMGMFAGHWYGKPDSYGAAEEIGGGKYVRLAADIIIAMKKTPILKDPNAAFKDKVVIGSAINACTLKNRFYPPFQETTVEINYKDGINKYAGLIDMALECGVVTKGGAWYTLPDETKVHGMNKVTEWFSENPDGILKDLEEALTHTGYSTTNKDIEEAERLGAEDE
jgi:recombination protein RecA